MRIPAGAVSPRGCAAPRAGLRSPIPATYRFGWGIGEVGAIHVIQISLEAHIDAQLADVLEAVRHAAPSRAIGTSGTITALVSMVLAADGEPSVRQEGATASRSAIARLRRRLIRLPAEERLARPGLDAKRNDLLPASAVLMDRMLRLGRIPKVQLCTWALREGLLLELAEVPTTRTAHTPSARHRSVAGLAQHSVYLE